MFEREKMTKVTPGFWLKHLGRPFTEIKNTCWPFREFCLGHV